MGLIHGKRSIDAEMLSRLKLPIILTVVILAVEIAGGLYTHSLALLSDAAHVFMDIVALSLAYIAIKISQRQRNHKVTFGYHRFEIFTSLINGILLVAVVIFLFFEAYSRLFMPVEVRGVEMLMIAIIGLAVNGYAVSRLRGHHDLNIRSAYMHVLGDMISSIVVVAAGILVVLTGNVKIDPILSFIIGGIILLGSFRLLYESALIMMEGTPLHVSIGHLRDDILRIKNVKGVHDIHVWSLCSHIHMLSAHILVDRNVGMATQSRILREINGVLEKKYGITHTTLQFECRNCGRNMEMH